MLMLAHRLRIKRILKHSYEYIIASCKTALIRKSRYDMYSFRVAEHYSNIIRQ